MNSQFPTASLSEVVTPVERAEVPIIGKVYRQIGVRLWGEGAYERASIEGGQTKYKRLLRVEADDIIVNKIWARNGSVAVVPEQLAGCYVSTEFPIFVPLKEKLDPRWFHWLSKTEMFWKQCDAKSRGTSGKNRIRPERFLEIEIPLPPIDAQRQVVELIQGIFHRINDAMNLRGEVSEKLSLLSASVLKDVFKQDDREEWANVALDSVMVSIQAGFACGEKSRTVGYPHLRMNNIDVSGRLDLSNLWYAPVSKEAATKYFLQAGDVLFNNTNSRELVGKTALFTLANVEYVFSNHLTRLRPDPSVVLSEWVAAYLRHLWRSHYFEKNCKRWINQAAFNSEKLAKLQIPLPTIAEQRALTNRLATLDEEAETIRKLQHDTSKEIGALPQLVLKKAFAGNL